VSVGGLDDICVTALYDPNDIHDSQRSPLGNLDNFVLGTTPTDFRDTHHHDVTPPTSLFMLCVHLTNRTRIINRHSAGPHSSCPMPIPFHSMHHGSTHASQPPTFRTSCNSQISTTAPHLTQHSSPTRNSALMVFHHIRIALDGLSGPEWSISHNIVLYAEKNETVNVLACTVRDEIVGRSYS
jgi:hypothetical protein